MLEHFHELGASVIDTVDDDLFTLHVTLEMTRNYVRGDLKKNKEVEPTFNNSLTRSTSGLELCASIDSN